MRKQILNILSCVLLTGIVEATPSIRVDARFDSSQILIGDQIYLTVSVEQPQNIKVLLPNFQDSLAGKIEILKVFPNDTQKLNNNLVRIQQKYLVTSFDSGVYQIGPITFKYQYENRLDSIISDPVLLTVNTIPIKDLTKIVDIKSILKIPLTFREVLPIMGIVLLIMILIFFGIYAYIRWKNKKPLFPFMEKPTEPAHIIAFRELEKLKEAKLWQQGNYKEYFSQLTDIVRIYIENRFQVPAMESTTYEIYQTLHQIDEISNEVVNDLYQTLQIADLVKFAKAEPLAEENVRAWETAFNFVSKTMPVVQELNIKNGNGWKEK